MFAIVGFNVPSNVVIYIKVEVGGLVNISLARCLVILGIKIPSIVVPVEGVAVISRVAAGFTVPMPT